MPRTSWTFLVATGCIVLATETLLVPAARAQSGAVKAVFEKHDLLGTFAWDCSRPASRDNHYFVDRLLDPDHVQRDQMVGPTERSSVTIIDKAADAGPNDVAASGTVDGRAVDLVWHLEANRMVGQEATVDGKKLISGRRVLANGQEVPWVNKCVQKLTIQSTPDGGGKCIDVTNGELKAGVRLQMWDCNDTASQIFSFDASAARLSVGSLCVEASGGRGQPGDLLALAPCNGAPSQAWKADPDGNLVKLVGINGLCFDIANNSKENRAALAIARCQGGPSQSFVLRQGLDLTLEESVNRDGSHIAELTLTAADPKLCQRTCIQNHQCSAWVYRKPEGRTDGKPHCWLLDRTTKVERGDGMLISGVIRPEAPAPPGR
jgi:hypothetical protein